MTGSIGNGPGLDLPQHNWAMTPPQYPYFPPPHPAGPVFRQVQERKRRSTIDIIFTLFMYLCALVAGASSFLMSAFWLMGGDECEYANRCDPPIGSALLATWGAIAVAAVIAVVGGVLAAKRGSVMWIWPTVALALIVAGFIIGYEVLVHWEAHFGPAAH